MTDETSKKFLAKLYVGDPKFHPPMDEGSKEECWCAYENAEDLIEKDNEQEVAVYEFKGVMKVKNETTIIE